MVSFFLKCADRESSIKFEIALSVKMIWNPNFSLLLLVQLDWSVSKYSELLQWGQLNFQKASKIVFDFFINLFWIICKYDANKVNKKGKWPREEKREFINNDSFNLSLDIESWSQTIVVVREYFFQPKI